MADAFQSSNAICKNLVVLGSKKFAACLFAFCFLFFSCGKNSILKAIVDEQSANASSDCVQNASFVTFENVFHAKPLDLPTNLTANDATKPDFIFADTSAIVYVLDLKENLIEAAYSLCNLFIWYLKHFKDFLGTMAFFVFIHKSDILSVDLLLQAIDDVQSICLDTVGENLRLLNVEYFTTSVYDSSINIAFGTIIQKTTAHMSYISQLLQIFAQKSKASCAVLVDGVSRLILAKETEASSFVGAETLLQFLDVFYDMGALSRRHRDTTKGVHGSLKFSKIIFQDGDALFMVEVGKSLCLIFKKKIDPIQCQKTDEKVLENASVFADCLFKMISSVKLAMNTYDTF